MNKLILVTLIALLFATLFCPVARAGEDVDNEIQYDDSVHATPEGFDCAGPYSNNEEILANYNRLRNEHAENSAQIAEQVDLVRKDVESRFDPRNMNSIMSTQSPKVPVQIIEANEPTEIVADQDVTPSAAPENNTQRVDPLSSTSGSSTKRNTPGANSFAVFMIIIIVVNILLKIASFSGKDKPHYNKSSVSLQHRGGSGVSTDFIHDDDYSLNNNWMNQQQTIEQNRLFMEQMQRDMDTAMFMHNQAVDTATSMHNQAVDTAMSMQNQAVDMATSMQDQMVDMFRQADDLHHQAYDTAISMHDQMVDVARQTDDINHQTFDSYSYDSFDHSSFDFGSFDNNMF